MPSIAEPSVQSLLVEMSFNGQPLATGTGFVVQTARGPTLITNRHNVTGRNQANGQPLSRTGGVPNEMTIVHNRLGHLGEWVGRKEPLHDRAGNPLWHEHPTLKAQADMAALLLTQLNDVAVYPYDVNNTGPDLRVGPADAVSVVGFPFGLQAGGSLAVWATGFMASEPDIDFNGLPVFLIDCRTRPGQSGSAVIAYRSGGALAMTDGSTRLGGSMTKFLGLYSGRINTESDLGIVWKARAIKELVDQI